MCHSTAYIRLFAKLALSLPVNELERLLHITVQVKVDSSDSRAVANAKSKEVQNQCYVKGPVLSASRKCGGDINMWDQEHQIHGDTT